MECSESSFSFWASYFFRYTTREGTNGYRGDWYHLRQKKAMQNMMEEGECCASVKCLFLFFLLRFCAPLFQSWAPIDVFYIAQLLIEGIRLGFLILLSPQGYGFMLLSYSTRTFFLTLVQPPSPLLHPQEPSRLCSPF